MGAENSILAKPPTWDQIQGGSDSPYLSQYGAGAEEAKSEGAAAEDDFHGKFWTSDRHSEATIRFAKKGNAAEDGFEAITLSRAFQLAAKNKGNTPALCWEDVPVKFNKDAPPPDFDRKDWETLTMQQYYDRTAEAAQAFINLGLERTDGVAIYGFNAPQWLMAEMAAVLAGGIAAGLYPTDTKDQVLFKCRHSGARIAAIENAPKLALFREIADDLPNLNAVVVWSVGEGDDMSDITTKDGRTIRVLNWTDLSGVATSEAEGKDKVDDRIAAQKPGHCCAYIYTSGTTGEPKAVMISHDNICYEARNAVANIPGMGDDKSGDRIISYLPLSHVAGMMVDIVCPIVVAAYKVGFVTAYFARPYDLKLGTIKNRLPKVEPTIFLGVPRVWEKFQEGVIAKSQADPPTGLKKSIITWAKELGLEHAHASQMGGSGEYGWFYGIAESKVHDVLKEKLGLTACKFAFTGAAPIKVETLEFFGALGLQINEVYGMSECTGATTWSSDAAHKWGSCGWAMQGAEVRILNPDGNKECPRWNSKSGTPPTEEEQGEVCYRGRHIMMGYMANPDLGPEHVATIKGKNASAIDDEGWLHSGDKGCMDEDGMVRITGRYKELIIGAGGENIAPVPIEDGVKARCPPISNIVMVGDKRKFNVALVTLKAEGATGELPGTNDLMGPAATAVDGVTTVSAAMASDEYAALIEKAIKDVNKDSTVVPSNAAKIAKFTILPHDLSITGGELGPTLKLKRGVVDTKYKEIIDRFYEDANKTKSYVPVPASAAAGAGGAAE